MLIFSEEISKLLPPAARTAFPGLAAAYDPATRTVDGVELFEEYDERGTLRAQRMVELRFCLLAKAAFEEMAGAAGFEVEALYGDYSYSAFDESTSPFMIWLLRRDGPPGSTVERE